MSVVTLVIFWKKVNSFSLSSLEAFCLTYLVSRMFTLKQGVGNNLREQEMKNGKKRRARNVVTDMSWVQVKCCSHVHFPIPLHVPHSPFHVPHSSFPWPFFPAVKQYQSWFFLGIQILGSVQRGVSRFAPHSSECLEQAEGYGSGCFCCCILMTL